MMFMEYYLLLYVVPPCQAWNKEDISGHLTETEMSTMLECVLVYQISRIKYSVIYLYLSFLHR